jgi:AcrR family transcriptional regulator
VSCIDELGDARRADPPGRSGDEYAHGTPPVLHRPRASLPADVLNGTSRLEEAALALFGEGGFDTTTVADIAARAGLTERTFFRHFADKRAVLFGGSTMLRDLLVREVADAPTGAAPIEAVATALVAASALLQQRREHARRRQAVISANTELREREPIKLAFLAQAMADALSARGVAPTLATLAAEAGIAGFKVAFQHWVTESEAQDLPQLIGAAFDELRVVRSGRRGPRDGDLP